MVLLDKKILLGGIAILVVGMIITTSLNSMIPVGKAGMSDDEIVELLIKQQQNQDMNTLSGILIGIGFLLILISFGARKKRKGSAKKIEKKPAS